MVNCGTTAIQVPAADGKMRFWRNTSDRLAGRRARPRRSRRTRSATSGTKTSTTAPARPACSTSPRPPPDVSQRLLDYGSNYGPGTATHRLTLYRAPSGALVFGAGTVQWSWGLDGNHDRGGSTADSRMQQATVNLLADMGVQPATLQAGLVAASASTDTLAPTATYRQLRSTARNVAGGSKGHDQRHRHRLDGGTGAARSAASRSRSTAAAPGIRRGRGNWTYSWTPSAPGPRRSGPARSTTAATSRRPGAQVTRQRRRRRPVPARSGTTSVTGPQDGDTNAVELGVKFRSDVTGFITGLRFYKTSGNTGTHIGHCGQRAAPSSPRPRSAASPRPAGRRSTSAHRWRSTPTPPTSPPITRRTATTPRSRGYFALVGIDSPPLHALADGVDGPNGIYKYGPSGGLFSGGGPEHLQVENYWVDVVFTTTSAPTPRSPMISAARPVGGATDVADHERRHARPSTSRWIRARSTAPPFSCATPSNTLVAATVTYSPAQQTVTLDPNRLAAASRPPTPRRSRAAPGRQDLAGNPLAADRPGRSRPRRLHRRRPTRARAARSWSSRTPPTRSAATTPRSCGPRA